jgi:DNA helicase-2/ATP-dependent DNA helicase PcrA
MKLAELWKSQRTYLGAADAVQNAFVQEHFVAKSAEPRGVHVMTIHKSKGKEFDEVVIYEGIHSDRIVRQPDDDYVVAQARLSLRVAVSRAKKKVTVVTPRQKPCELL